MEEEHVITLVQAPEPTKLYLGKDAREKLYKLGAKSLAVILFDEFWGPVFQYYYVKRSKLVSKLFENRAMPVELSVVGKYVREMVLKDGSRVIILPFRTKGSAAEKTNYILVELRENVRNKKRLLEILFDLVSDLSKMRDVNTSILSELMRKKLLGNSKVQAK